VKLQVELGTWQPALNEAGLAVPIQAVASGKSQLRLLTAENVLPTPAGYAPVPDFQPALVVTPITERPQGAYAGFDDAANGFNVAGSATKLWWLTGDGTFDVTGPAGGYRTPVEGRWELTQFGNVCYGTNYLDPLQARDLFGTLGSTPEKFTNITAAPQAAHLAIISQQLVLGDLIDPVEGAKPARVQWSAVGNPQSWPTPGTDLAASVLSDRQDLEGPYGRVQRIIGGGDGGIIFQERAVWRMDFTGGDVIYNFQKVEDGRGLLTPGLVISLGNRRILYLAEDGLNVLTAGSGSDPIAQDSVSPFLLRDISEPFLSRSWAAADPDRPIVYFLYVDTTSTTGIPNKLLVWNWALDRFALIRIADVEVVFPVAASGAATSLEAPPPDEDIDLPPDESWDKVQVSGLFTLGGFKGSPSGTPTAWQLSTMDAAPTSTARLVTGMVEWVSGRRSFLRGIRPIVSDFAGSKPTITSCGLQLRSNNIDTEDTVVAQASRNSDGVCQFRADARYSAVDVRVAGNFEYLSGVEVDYDSSGDR